MKAIVVKFKGLTVEVYAEALTLAILVLILLAIAAYWYLQSL